MACTLSWAPLIVGLGGTDIYRFQHSDPDATLGSMRVADMLVGLHDLVSGAIPEEMHGKLRVIYQSVPPLPRRLPPLRDAFEVLVIGHLREEKDPLRTAQASRLLPDDHGSASCISAWRTANSGPQRRTPSRQKIPAINGVVRCRDGRCDAPWRARR